MPQDYALAVTFSYDGKEDIQLYNRLSANARVRSRQAERERERDRARQK